MDTRKLNNHSVVVSWNPTELYLRKTGKKYYGTEERLLNVKSGKLTIHKDVAEKFGMSIEILEETNE